MSTMMMKSRILLQQQRMNMIKTVVPSSSACYFNTASFSTPSSNPSPTTTTNDDQMMFNSPDASSRGISTFQRLNQQLQFDPAAALSKINNNKTNINFTSSYCFTTPVGTRRTGSTVRMLYQQQQQPNGTTMSSSKMHSNEISNNKTNINDVSKKYFGDQMK